MLTSVRLAAGGFPRSRARAATLLLVVLVAPIAAQGQVKGDLNEDGIVDVGDAVLLLRIVRGDLDPSVLTDEALADVGPIVGGVGGDGNLGVEDVLLMMRALAGFDVDGDGLDTAAENAIGTSPFLADTDGDGYPDAADPDPLAPNPPQNPTSAHVIEGPDVIQIAWLAPQETVGSYVIHRYGTDGDYQFFVNDGPSISFTDDTAGLEPTYFYWVQAVNAVGQTSEYVDCDVADAANERPWMTGARATVANPWFDASGSPSRIDLEWTASPTSGVTGYKIWMSSSPVPLGSTTGLGLQATVSGGAAGVHALTDLAPGTYYLRVTAFSGAIDSRLESAKQVALVVP